MRTTASCRSVALCKRLLIGARSLLAGSLLVARAVSAACVPDARVEPVSIAWLAHRPQQSLSDLDPEAALCFRQALMERLATRLGPIVGYKVAVYTPAARSTYATSSPIVGVLRQKMLIDAGVPITVDSGVALVAEADFILVIKDAGINTASSREKAYEHLRGYRPFIELPDGNYRPESKPSLGQLMALNANARYGVLGTEVALPQTPEGFKGLSELAADVTFEGTAEGTLRLTGAAKQTLGDPVEIVLAARDGLRQEGVQLKAGDLISIGTLVPPHPVRAGENLHIRYRVLSKPSEVSAKFVP